MTRFSPLRPQVRGYTAAKQVKKRAMRPQQFMTLDFWSDPK